ncbi:ABC-type Fe3+-hydroxamate transport system substrate-binding protein [Mucilaginibacter lappiensis]|uniref:ABC-type Fe3+-hydroxamate transport system substrate-binding protein n=1 Tax=Mucilaginibacter lappiensis TaxID=354630 RepID=A0ABR6PE40_9SPHI|nr:helical backbone metal receptor [Mucilaginibacter lappiensis]MBB6108038.1 ABC-type Fe3+-hydroxamate transport system substrate-binding protein [Mucilaginibacter lappiensis]
MAVFHDQLNRVVSLSATPQRIISIVPSQTELLFYLGLDTEVIGITKFCIHPEDKFKALAKVGGTKQLNIDQIRALKPDLIIANKEENERSQVEELMNICQVWISDIHDLDSALEMIRTVGLLVNRETEAQALYRDIISSFAHLALPAINLSIAYFIWRKPYMVAGSGTFIDNMLQRCGLINAIDKDRYPEITPQEIIAISPDLIFLSSEPYPFKQKHIDEFKLMLPHAKVILVDGEMFSWYGSRLLYAAGYFKTIMQALTLN